MNAARKMTSTKKIIVGFGGLIVTLQIATFASVGAIYWETVDLTRNVAVVETRIDWVESHMEIFREDMSELRSDVSYLTRLHIEARP